MIDMVFRCGNHIDKILSKTKRAVRADILLFPRLFLFGYYYITSLKSNGYFELTVNDTLHLHA